MFGEKTNDVIYRWPLNEKKKYCIWSCNGTEGVSNAQLTVADMSIRVSTFELHKTYFCTYKIQWVNKLYTNLCKYKARCFSFNIQFCFLSFVIAFIEGSILVIGYSIYCTPTIRGLNFCIHVFEGNLFSKIYRNVATICS